MTEDERRHSWERWRPCRREFHMQAERFRRYLPRSCKAVLREAVKQRADACALPVAVAGALMPDAHVGIFARCGCFRMLFELCEVCAER